MRKKKNRLPKLPDSAYWRYKKQTPPIDEFEHLNGEVKIIKPRIDNTIK